MTHVAAPLAISASLFLSLGWPALAANPHDSTNPKGRPTQSCGSATAPTTPGNAASARVAERLGFSVRGREERGGYEMDIYHLPRHAAQES